MAYGTFNGAGYLQLPSSTPAGNYTLHVTNVAGTATVASYVAPLNTLGTTGNALTVLASGFLTPANNSNGAAFGLWAALPSGGNLVQLPALVTTNIKTLALNNTVASIFPNPANSNIKATVVANNDELAIIQIFDANGKLVITNSKVLTTGSNTLELNIDELTNGVYFMQINHGSTLEKGKFIKE